jgi:hypothetical protein
MSKPHDDKDRRGAQQHAEGQQGDKTRAAFDENLHHPQRDADDDVMSAEGSKDFDAFGRPKPGHHRLNEDREQHDPAEKDSEIKHDRR